MLALDFRNAPAAADMAIDRIEVGIPARLWSQSGSGCDHDRAFSIYRELLSRRTDWDRGDWTVPGTLDHRFTTSLRTPSRSTIGGARLTARRGVGAHELYMVVTANPTRTLAHLVSELEADEAGAIAILEAMSADQFFARSPNPKAARTLDDEDNALADFEQLHRMFGADPFGAFLSIFERKLQQWSLAAFAPLDCGFLPHRSGRAAGGVQRVALDWERLVVRNAEVYCERHHGGAVALMNRLSGDVANSHAEVDWRSYQLDETGGRSGGSATIGIHPTANTRLSFYAKTATRVRIETRYTKRVRDTLRNPDASAATPLADLLIAAKVDAAVRLVRPSGRPRDANRAGVLRSPWEALCAMCAEPPAAMIGDVARLLAELARASSQAKVDPEPLFVTLLSSGGVEQTPRTGLFPRRLLKRLVERGVLDPSNLYRRMPPGQPRRMHLTPHYREVFRRLRQTFGSEQNGSDG